jgi:hypothetical protein
MKVLILKKEDWKLPENDSKSDTGDGFGKGFGGGCRRPTFYSNGKGEVVGHGDGNGKGEGCGINWV